MKVIWGKRKCKGDLFVIVEGDIGEEGFLYFIFFEGGVEVIYVRIKKL